jgi:hypothetical protein
MTVTFKIDLEKGIKVESMLLDKLKLKYPSSTLVNAFKGYDIWIPEIHKSIEVKYDEKSKETGNIVVEIEFNGKPSALLTTTADYWVFYDGDVFVSIEPKEIIKCIFMNKLHYAEFTGKGDTKSKKAFLIKKDILFNYGKIIK